MYFQVVLLSFQLFCVGVCYLTVRLSKWVVAFCQFPDVYLFYFPGFFICYEFVYEVVRLSGSLQKYIFYCYLVFDLC